MPQVHLARADTDLVRCFPVIKQLRPHLTESGFVEQAKRQGAQGGYQIAVVEAAGVVTSVAGFRLSEGLVDGKFLYIDDLVTDEAQRSRGYGDHLFDWLVNHAREQGCAVLGLESGVQRFDAHRFYLRKRMRISSYHFALPLRDAKS